jgi:hypothetical protein
MAVPIRGIALTTGLLAMAGAGARAKPPELPTSPEVEFKVLSPTAQEYYQPDTGIGPSVFVPITDWSPLAAAAAKVGDAVIEALTNNDPWARLVYEMAETHRRAGDLSEARRWYTGVREMYPQSVFAQLAKQQLELPELLQIASEAGEEQSEEPPAARVGSVELLTVMPRLVRQIIDAEQLDITPWVVKP